MKTTTLFSFGYWGWGTSSSHLVEAVDAIEENRGFNPPIFVDVRFSRAVRAPGFKGAAFENQLGDDRYRWMKSLGNKRIVMKSSPGMQIAEPKAANVLLDLAMQAVKGKRRLIFFCSCQWPRWEGEVACHRSWVASLLLARAGKRGIPIEVVEWPGGKPGHMSIDLQPDLFRKVRDGRLSIPVGRAISLRDWDGPPWGTTCSFHCGGERFHRIVGPPFWQKDEWCLPVLDFHYDPDVGLARYEKDSTRLLKEYGLTPKYSVVK